MPAAPPEIQRSVPLVDVAPRGLLPVMASVRAVVVSRFPLPSTRPMTRGTVVEALVAGPLHTSRRCDPTVVTGTAIDCTRTPAGVYSSRNTAVPLALSAADPSPTR